MFPGTWKQRAASVIVMGEEEIGEGEQELGEAWTPPGNSPVLQTGQFHICFIY